MPARPVIGEVTLAKLSWMLADSTTPRACCTLAPDERSVASAVSMSARETYCCGARLRARCAAILALA